MDCDKIDTLSISFCQQPSIAALGSSAALGGAAAVALVTASALPLMNHTEAAPNRILPSHIKRISRTPSSNLTIDNRHDGGSILANGK